MKEPKTPLDCIKENIIMTMIMLITYHSKEDNLRVQQLVVSMAKYLEEFCNMSLEDIHKECDVYIDAIDKANTTKH